MEGDGKKMPVMVFSLIEYYWILNTMDMLGNVVFLVRVLSFFWLNWLFLASTAYFVSTIGFAPLFWRKIIWTINLASNKNNNMFRSICRIAMLATMGFLQRASSDWNRIKKYLGRQMRKPHLQDPFAEYSTDGCNYITKHPFSLSTIS